MGILITIIREAIEMESNPPAVEDDATLPVVASHGQLPAAPAQLVNNGPGPQIACVQGDVNIGPRIGKKELEELARLIASNRRDPMLLSGIRSEKYNLFVVENEIFETGSFCMPLSKCMTKHISGENKKRYGAMDAKAFAELKQYPCIFATRNQNFLRTTELHHAIFGIIDDLKLQGNLVKVVYKPYTTFSQNILNTHPAQFGLLAKPVRNEMDTCHWTVKDVDLIQILSLFGVEIKEGAGANED